MEGTPVWLDLVAEPIYAVLHEPEGEWRNTAALVLPTFAWDDSCSYRSRRQWAVELARAGFPAVRFDLPGTEDSLGSPLADGRFASWLEAVTEIARWLRETTGAERIVGNALGLGGLLAIEAINRGAEIDDLALWGVPARGRSYIRELRLYADAMSRDGPEPARPDGAFAIGGHLLAKETADAIEAIKLTGAPLPNAEDRRVLLIGRDAHGVDERLRAHLDESGAEVTVLASDQYAAMMTFPDFSEVPARTIAAAVEWLRKSSEVRPKPIPLVESSAACDEICFEHRGQTIRERQVTFETASGALVGILAEPVSVQRKPLGLISHNSGALRRTSPARMWTDMCRRWAAQGVPTLRFDMEGLGDSPGRFVPYAELDGHDESRIIGSRIEIADALERDGIADRFVTVGLCLSAYWELKVAVSDRRVRGTVLLNESAFDWTPEQRQERARRAALGPLRHVFRHRPDGFKLLSVDMIRRITTGVILTLRGVVSAAGRSQLRPAVTQFDALADSGTRTLMLFTPSEALYGQMRRTGLLKMLPRWPQVRVEELPTKDHDLRPLRVQAIVRERIDRFIEELLTALSGDDRGPSTRPNEQLLSGDGVDQHPSR